MFLGLVISVLLPKIVDFRGEKCRGHRILKGQFFELQKAGHMSHIESPEEVIEALEVIFNTSANNSNKNI